ncbi:MAG: T9SS type A sorting domain-containing protein [Bacteroidota bacterium]
MNKNLLTIGLFVLGTTISLAQSKSLKEKITSKTLQNKENSMTRAIVFRPGFAINYWWDSFNSNWQLNDSSLYQYDSEGYETAELRKINGYINGRNLKTYDASNRLTETLYQYYDNVNMIYANSSRDVKVYDAQGNQIESRYDNWNSTSSLWDISSGYKYIRTYDANGNMLESISQNYNSSNMAYENSYKYVSTFDAFNNILTDENYDWDGTSWVKTGKDTYIYTAGVLTSFESQSWDGTTYVNSERYIDIVWVDWVNVDESDITSYTTQEWDGTTWQTISRLTATYDQYGGSVMIYEDYLSNVWTNSSKYSSSYDSYSNHLGDKSENWVNNTWVIDYESKIIYTYDVDGNMTQKINQYWDDTDMILKNQSRKDYGNYAQYSNSVSINELNKSIAVKVYPNPVISKGTIEINTANLSDNARFILSDLTGKEVLNLKATNEFSFDRTNLKNGFYTFKVLDNSNQLTSGKIILE